MLPGGEGIYQTIRQFPQQFLKGWEAGDQCDFSSLHGKNFRKVFYAGMGGSSLPADLLNDFLQGELRLQIVRDYRLPKDTTGQDLILFASYSGNTEETLTALEHALDLNCPVVVLSHGGKIKKTATERLLPFISIPDCIQPRLATGYFFSGTLAVLHRLGLVGSKKNQLEELSSFLVHRQDRYEEIGKGLASKLKNKIPIIYGPPDLYGACRNWKIKFNENSKVPSFFNVFPELNHNEMVGFTQAIMNPAFIYLKNQSMDQRITQRMEVMKNLLKEKFSFHEINLSGKNLLQEMFEALAIGDYASYHLALNYGIDPVPVKMIEEFKEELKRNEKR